MTTLLPVGPAEPNLPHFMLQDVLGSLLGVVAFAAVLYAPGYVVGFATDLFGFRRLSFPWRSVWATALSFCVAPILAYLIGLAGGLPALCVAFVLFGAATLLLLLQRGSLAGWAGRDARRAVLVAAGWALLVLVLLIDVQAGHRLFYSVVMADQSYRIAFTDAVVRTGIPPANPLYFAGSPAPMRYYYFWYVLCAAVVRLAHITSRQAFIASSVWAGFGLIATVQLYTTHFFHWARRQRWLALGLLLITGADLVPAVGQALLQPTLNGDTEWWSVDPIDGWPDSLLWVPHHVAAVLCCLLAFLFLWRVVYAPPSALRSTRVLATTLAALAFASAVGLSVYVAFGFALMVLGWLLWLFLRRDPSRAPFALLSLGAGLLSLVPLLPFLRELTRIPQSIAKTSAQSSAFPFTLSVRRLIDSELLTDLPIFRHLHASHPVLLDQGVRLLLLVPGLAMELGLYGAALLLLLRARRQSPASFDAPRDSALFFTVFGFALTIFVSSAVITNNDFGYRAVMLPQFFLLLLTADLLGSWNVSPSLPFVTQTAGRRRLLYSLLILGAAGTIYWAVLLRAWLPLEAAHPQTGYTSSPEDEFEIRQAFATLDRLAPPAAVVSFRPIDPTPDRQGAVMVPNEYYQRMLVMDSGRQLLNAEEKCAVHFGGDPAPCAAIQAGIRRLYAAPSIPDAREARAVCNRFGVSFLVMSPWDPSWTARSGWPLSLPLVAEQSRLRIFDCR